MRDMLHCTVCGALRVLCAALCSALCCAEHCTFWCLAALHHGRCAALHYIALRYSALRGLCCAAPCCASHYVVCAVLQSIVRCAPLHRMCTTLHTACVLHYTATCCFKGHHAVRLPAQYTCAHCAAVRWALQRHNARADQP